MSHPVIEKALEVLAASQDFDALRRALFATVTGRFLATDSSSDPQADPAKDGRLATLNALLARLPTRSLASVASIVKGKTGIKDAIPGQFPLVVTAEARASADHFDFEGPAVMIPMVSSTGHGDASLKRIHFQDGQYAVGSILSVVQPKDPRQLSARCLHAYLSAFKDELLVSRMVGTANVSLTISKIGEVPVPLLPITVQRKIDELMALCDRLEARQADAASAHAQLVQTLLDSLTQAKDADDFATSWQRLSAHFDVLFTTEASIDALKQAILQLAVMGKLAPQDPSDEPASELLKRIAEERAQLVVKRNAKKQVLSVEEVEGVHDLPTGWVWSRLGSQVIESGAGWSPNCESRPRVDDEWGVLKVSAVSWGAFDPGENKALPQGVEPRPEHEVVAGDFLISRANTVELVARSVLVESVPEKLMLSDKIVRLKLTSLCERRYVNMANSTLAARDYYGKVAGGTSSSMKNVTREQILNLPIALPPLEEQKRIVAKVDELMALCDQLKAQLNAARHLHEKLAGALVEQAVA